MSSAEVRIRPADLGWLGAAVGIVLSLGLVALRQANSNDLGPGSFVESSVGWLAFWSGPAIVGGIGTAIRRREIVVGAGLSYTWMAALSLSGVTFILLVPAILFLYAGLRSPSGASSGRPTQPLLAVAILALFAGSFIGLFGTLQTVCWEQSADGTVRTHLEADDGTTGEVSVGTDGVVASGCSGGQVSSLGSAIAVACVAAAATTAILSARRGSGPAGGTGTH
jgi:hypothetical protein